MTAKLTIELDDAVLDALRKAGSITFRIVPGAAAGAAGGATPREGSLPAQLLEWAAEDGEPFTTADVVAAFGLSRAHASMLVGKLANGAYPLRRVRRGVYQHQS